MISSNNYFQINNIHHFLLQQPWLMILLISGVLYIVILPICGILFFCDLCVCATADSVSSSEVLEITEEKKTSKYVFALSLIMMAIIVAVIVILMFVYVKSVNDAAAGSNGIDQSIHDIYGDINLLIIAASHDLTCKLNKTLRKLSAEINDTIQRLPNKIIKTLKQDCPIISIAMMIERFDIKNVTNFISDVILKMKSMKSLANNLPKALYQQSSMENVINTLERIENRTANLLQQYNDILKATNDTRNNVEFLLDKIIEMITLTLKQTNDFVKATMEKSNLIIMTVNQVIYNLHLIVQKGYQKIDDFIEVTLKNPGVQAAAISVYIFAIIPVPLVIIPSIIVIICGIHLLTKNDRYRWNQQGNWRCAGLWSLHAVGAAFFTGWITMLIASITFTGSFAVETICQPFFRDEQMKLYRSSYFNYEIANFINFSKSFVGIGEFLYQCKNHKSILSAFKMESFLHYYEQMYAKYLPDAAQHAKRLLRGQFLKLTLTETQIAEFTNTSKELVELKKDLLNYVIPSNVAQHEQLLNASFVDVKRQVSEFLAIAAEMEKNVIEVAKRSLHSENLTLVAQKVVAYEYNLTISDISRRIMHAKFYLLNRSFKCRPFYDTILNVGTVFCKQLSRPIHGIWSSASLIAISFLAIIIIILCISTFFFSLNNNFERRLRNGYDVNKQRISEKNFHDRKDGKCSMPHERNQAKSQYIKKKKMIKKKTLNQ